MGLQFAAYAFVSSCLASATLSYAVHTRQQFYPIVVFLVTSKISVVILGNFAVLCTLLAGRLAKTFFLGRLRDQEREIMYDRARYAITETCLALTIFHEELSVKVFALFTALLFSKVFHWLCECRVEFIQQDDGANYWHHFRLVSLIGTLLVTDVALLSGCTWLCLQQMPSVLILFGFEYAILAVAALSTAGKYVLQCVDGRVEGTWQAKGSWSKALDFLTEAMRFALFLMFFGIIFTYYGMPLHIVRELWISFANLRKCWQQYRKYQRLMKGLNDRFPDATEEDITAEGGGFAECIICRDDLTPIGCKKIPCGHVFHLDCLRLWLQEKQDCPTCRADIPVDTPLPDRRRRPRDVVPNANAAMAAAAAEANAAAAQNPPLPAAAAASAGGGGAATANPAAAPPLPTNPLQAPAPSQGQGASTGGAAASSSGPSPFSPSSLSPFGNGFQHHQQQYQYQYHHLGAGSPAGGATGGGSCGGGGGFGSPFAPAGFAPSPLAFHHPYGAGPFGSPHLAAPSPSGPTLLKIVSPRGAVLLQRPSATAPETRRVANGAVLVATAPYYEQPGTGSSNYNAPSFYATPEGDWLAVGREGSGVEVLQPPPATTSFVPGFGGNSPFGFGAAAGGAGFFPGSSPLHASSSSPFPATPFGSPFATAAANHGSSFPFPLSSPASHPSGPSSGSGGGGGGDGGGSRSQADVAALTAELAALRAMVQTMQAKESTAAAGGATSAAAGEVPDRSACTAESAPTGGGQDGGLRRRKV